MNSRKERRSFLQFSIIMLFTLSFGASGAGLADLELNLNVRKVTLSNGLRLLMLQNNRLPIYSLYTFYDVGGRHERKGTTGATHFLEHMMFKGSKKFGPGEFDRFVEGNGGRNNAYTTFDSTVYYESMPSHTLEQMIAIEAARMESILLIPPQVESERKVVLEERKLRYENSPQGKLYQTMMKAVFEGTPYGGSVIGEAEDVSSLSREGLLKFHEDFYAPNNAILVIVGDLDFDETEKWVKNSFGTLKRNRQLEEQKKEREAPSLYRHQGRYQRDISFHAKVENPIFIMAFPGVGISDERAFALDFVSNTLGGGESSYLVQKYVKNDRPLFTRVSAGNYNLMHNGVFYFSGELRSGVSLAQSKKALLKEARIACDKAIDDRSLQKSKNQFLVSYYSEIQSNSGIASFLGLRESFFGDYKFYKKELKVYGALNVAEVRKACRDVFKEGKYIFVSGWEKHPEAKGKK